VWEGRELILLARRRFLNNKALQEAVDVLELNRG
jgi:hypothetical protein